MQGNLKSRSFRIGGMTCGNCRDRIEKKLKNTPGVEDASVNFTTGSAAVAYDEQAVSFDGITAAVEKLGYTVLDDKAGRPVLEITGTLVLILALYALLRGLGMSSLASAFPLAEPGTGYGMLFIIGLVTSVHCAAMCGGINLSQCIAPAVPAGVPAAAGGGGAEKRLKVLVPSVLYNAGRVVSYTGTGILVGALGSVITVSGRFRGLVQLAAGIFMVIMGINMLGFFPGLRRFIPGLPKFFTKKIDRQKAGSRSPLFIGLLNGLMPCGPLQAMQLYALSTGSPLAGGISMFLFSMGTVPLMFGLGALSSLLSTRGPALTRRMTRAGAVLITVMGMTMLSYGFSLSGFNFDFAGRAAGINPLASRTGGTVGAFMPVIEKGVQLVNSTLSGGRYPAITVQQGLPVRWIIDAPAGSINGCNNRMIIREYGIEHRFRPGENVIEFTPSKTGKFTYSCWMGMIRSSITVVAEGGGIAEAEPEPDIGPSPAGVEIPTEHIGLAEIQEEGYQTVKIALRDDGIEPAVVVMQSALPAVWIIHNDSLDPGNRRLIFPAYYIQLEMKQGDNAIQLLPMGDFDFSTADNVFYGYVKVVDDLNDLDLEAIRAEVSGHETLIYPDAYFEAAAQGAGCCAR